MKKNILYLMLFMAMAILLSACSEKESGTDAGSQNVSEKAQKTFLMYSETTVNDEGTSIGDLYVKTADSEEEKIAGGVVSGGFEYNYNNEKILFIDEENTLYEAEAGQDKVELASDVLNYNANHDGNIITYQNQEEDLYILNEARESEKIASEILQFKLDGSEIYYLGYDGDFNVYNTESREETLLASNVVSFKLLDGHELVYTNDDYMLFYKNDDEESVKITSKEVDSMYIEKVGDSLLYKATEEDGYNLYLSTLDGSDTKLVASDIYEFVLDGNNIYYLTNDRNLFTKKVDEEKATKLISEISNFTLAEDFIYFTDEDSNYYRQKGTEKKEKIASDVVNSAITESGEILYQTSEDELFLEKTKLASDVDAFSLFDNNIAYGTKDNKLYFMEVGKEPKLLADKLEQYSTVNYQEEVIFSNYLSFEEIAGYYYYSEYEEKIYYEFSKDGYLIDPMTGEKLQMELDYAGFNYLNVMVDGDYGTIRLDGETLSLENDEEILNLTKTTKEEMDKSIAAYKKELEKSALAEELEEARYGIESLIGDYLYEYMYAVNTGYTSSLDLYISSNSNFFETQTDYAMSLYDKGTTLDLMDYSVRTPEKTGDNTYKVPVEESFSIYKEDGTSNDSTYTSYYEVKNLQGEWYITNMEVAK